MQAGGRIEDNTVCDLLFEQVEKPSDFLMCKAINVYDNKYRVNVYTRKYDVIRDLETTVIGSSYFVIYDGENITIKA